jgi:putative transposase
LLIETDVEGLIGAGRYERSSEPTTWRNGHRDRTLNTRLDALQLRIPKLRQGSYFPPFLDARKSSEKALIAVIQEAWIGDVSTRRVDDLVQAMGCPGSASRRCPSSARRSTSASMPSSTARSYLWLDATYLRRREGVRIVSVAAIIAVAANTDGRREIVGLHTGPSDAETFWSTFLKSLVRRGLRGVKLVVSDAHESGHRPGVRRWLATLPRGAVEESPWEPDPDGSAEIAFSVVGIVCPERCAGKSLRHTQAIITRKAVASRLRFIVVAVSSV